jgi:hypothetical protein
MNRRVFLSSAVLLPRLAGDSEDGFASLFDGKSLNGWSVREGPESAFYVRDGAITVSEASNYPTWLGADKHYENFDLRLEFFIRGWMDSGLYIHAPEHGRPAWCGMDIKLFHKQDAKPLAESAGAIFPLVPPLKVNVRNRGEWNSMRVLMDWPRLSAWINEEPVQDLDVETVPELKYRLRRGYIGLESLSYPIRFRNIRIRELAAKEQWQTLYESPDDLSKWTPIDKAKWEPLGRVLRGDGLGHLATKELYQDFELHLYLRASKHSNGGVLFRAAGAGPNSEHYEIQVHDVENAVYPTGSLYHYKRAIYPKIEPERWYLMQVIAKSKSCIVRINGDNVMEYHDLERTGPGAIMLQAHQSGKWIEYKHVKVKRI